NNIDLKEGASQNNYNDKKDENNIVSLEEMGYPSADIENIIKLKEIAAGTDLKAKVLKMAQELEGSIKNTGVHASAIIIAPQSLLELMPISVAKNTEMYVTQIEGKDIESAGVIKMDFLGLKTLSIIKNTSEMIKRIFNIELDTENLPLTDEATFKLFQQGNTIGVFQFESPGMQKYLIGIKPDKIDDLIALCALYRPGPMAYIDKYINRKFGREQVTYDLPIMKNILESTYGIVIYQEQVMLLSKLLANFTGAEADDLRKAMGKKNIVEMKKKEAYFLEKCIQNNYPEDIVKKIWRDWESFAEYAFNKSHSVIYAIVAYTTAYLKANYPAAFMASCLNYASNIEAISFILEDCNKNNIRFFGPDIN
ncbi:MAG: DNA polymerase III subunit alpha, partial [Sediminibacterium sp.]|nr:DNA polymerase III subunit alpha [Sediminibacterium sp.]